MQPTLGMHHQGSSIGHPGTLDPALTGNEHHLSGLTGAHNLLHSRGTAAAEIRAEGRSMGTRGKALGQNHIVNQLKAPDREIGNPPVGTGNPPLGTGTPPVGTDSRVMRAEINQMAGTPDMSVTVTGMWM